MNEKKKSNFVVKFDKKCFVLLLGLVVSFSNLYSSNETVTVGTTGASYSTLKAAFDAINDGTLTGSVTIQIITSTTETATATLNDSGVGASFYSNVHIYPDVPDCVITGAIDGSAVIVFNGGSNVTLDGSLGAEGNNYSLTIINSSTSSDTGTGTIRFENGASHNIVRFCNIKGSEKDPNSGIIAFLGSVENGNNNNVLEYNNITNEGGNRPSNAIYSSTFNEAILNSHNSILNNDIYDIFENASNYILIDNFNSYWDINNNSFFEQSPIFADGDYSQNVIVVNTYPYGKFNIKNNYIGGSSAHCEGDPMTKSDINSSVHFTGIYLNVGINDTTNVQGNVISNISYSNQGSTNWYGLKVDEGYVNIGDIQGNTIGSATGNGSISFTNGQASGQLVAIQLSSTTSNDLYCKNNVIGSIDILNSSSDLSNSFCGIKINISSSHFIYIDNNAIGSSTTINSINAGSASNTDYQTVYGVFSSGTSYIVNNTISNLTNATTNTTTNISGTIKGIYSTESGGGAVSNNTISNLKIGNANASSNVEASVVGVAIDNNSNSANIEENNIYNLSNTNPDFTGCVYGVYIDCQKAYGGGLIKNNFIHDLNVSSTNSTPPIIAGINLVYGVPDPGSSAKQNFYNNIISLSSNSSATIKGIYCSGYFPLDMFFNTIYIGGATSNSVAKSYAHYLSYGTNLHTRNYQNNIFYNDRTAPGSNKNFAVYFENAGGVPTTSLTLDYNDYFTSGTAGTLACFSGSYINSLPITTGKDANSLTINPSLFNPTSISKTDYRTSKNTLKAGISIASVTTDFRDANTRPATPTIGTWEYFDNKWTGSVSTDWNTSSNWSQGVPLPDDDIVFDATVSNDCVLDQNRSVGSITNSYSSYRVNTNGNTLTVKGDLNLTNGAQINASSSGSSVDFSGSSAQSIPSGTFINNEVFNLAINNLSHVTLNGTLRILNSFTATSGMLNAYTSSPTVVFAGLTAQTIQSNQFLNGQISNLTIDNSAGVTLNADLTVNTSLTINSGKLLTVAAAKLLNVEGTITNNANESGLLLKTGGTQSANASLIYHNAQNAPVFGTVEMYSKAYWNLSDANVNNRYKWQFFGIPVTTVDADPTFYGAYVRQYNEQGKGSGYSADKQWIQMQTSSVLSPFKGYEIVQPAAKTYTIQGQLINSNYEPVLTYTSGADSPGENLLSNPYTTAIDISKMSFGANTEATVYLYNTGSFADWNTPTKTGTSPGQYTVSTPGTAGNGGVPAQIPSMQAYTVVCTAPSSISCSYSSLVASNSEKQRAPSITKSEKVYTVIDVAGKRYTDKMWLFTEPNCTRNFDNGWDGRKAFGSGFAPQICAIEPDGTYQIDVVNDINNTELSFKAGEDTTYTLTFAHINTQSKYNTLYLLDEANNKVTDISADSAQYTFTALPTTTAVKRFKIIANSNLTTKTDNLHETQLKVFYANKCIFVQNKSEYAGELKLVDITGKTILNVDFKPAGITAIPASFPPGTYILQANTADSQLTKSVIIN